MTRSAARFATFAALALSALVMEAAHAECFSMYDAKNALVYQSGTSPIDLSRPVSEEMARRFPARSLVISTTITCPDATAPGSTPGRYDGYGDFAGTSTSPAAGRAASSPSDGLIRTRSPARGR